MQKDDEKILSNRIDRVWFCDHIMDNSAIALSFYETMDNLRKMGYNPVGFCLNPEYKEKSGVGLVCEDKEFNTVWFHVNSYIIHKWAVQLKRTPPEDVIWEDDMMLEYLFK